MPCVITKGKDHGRVEEREYRLLTDLSWLPEKDEWTGLNAVGMVRSTLTRDAETSLDLRYFITSLEEAVMVKSTVTGNGTISKDVGSDK